MTSIEQARRLIVSQAIRKGWNNTDEFLFNDKLPEELTEFFEAFFSGDKVQTAKEFIDVFYIMVQMVQNLDPQFTIDLNMVFADIFLFNDKHGKKTKDELGNWVRK